MGQHMYMDQIEWFCLAYELGSFKRAAEHAFISRQAFGKAISGMEAELGAELFVRTAQGVTPTKFAHNIYPDLKICRNTYEKVLTASELFRDRSKQMIRMVITDGMAVSLPGNFLSDITEAFPDYEFIIEKHYVTRCFELVEQNQADFAICSSTGAPDDLSSILIVSHPVYLAISRELVDFPVDNPSFEDLARFTFFSQGHNFPDDVEYLQLFEKNGYQLKTVARYNDFDLIEQQVVGGKGISAVPGPVLDRFADKDVAILPFPDPDKTWDLGLHYREDQLTSATSQIVDWVRDYAERVRDTTRS